MGLSKEEKEVLERLSAKAKEPDTPSGNISFNLDLSNDAAWDRARKLGLIPADDDTDDDDADDDADDKPSRPGYFGK